MVGGVHAWPNFIHSFPHHTCSACTHVTSCSAEWRWTLTLSMSWRRAIMVTNSIQVRPTYIELDGFLMIHHDQSWSDDDIMMMRNFVQLEITTTRCSCVCSIDVCRCPEGEQWGWSKNDSLWHWIWIFSSIHSWSVAHLMVWSSAYQRQHLLMWCSCVCCLLVCRWEVGDLPWLQPTRREWAI